MLFRSSRPASRTAVVARMAAMPSRRLSCSALRLPFTDAARTRARSSRRSKATAWNFARTAGVTRPRWAAASTSRTVRESTEMTSSRWRTFRCLRGAVRRTPFWRWPGRATNSSSGCRAQRPRQHAAQAHRRDEECPGRGACYSGRRADLRISEDQRSCQLQASHTNPEPPADGLVTMTLYQLMSTYARAHNSRLPPTP